jgi:2-polyprenyl-3-methyl-5-hydroxy-6-metoxy-1,4-benzoquinol methylase
MTRPFVDFYNEIGFAPTSQQLGRSFEHKQNRSNLYRKLGIHKFSWLNASVLEVGPGSGENSIDLVGRGIKSLTLADAVPVVLERIKAKNIEGLDVKYELLDVSQHSLSGSYQIVICEGTIPFQLEPRQFLSNISCAVEEGGLLLITTVDAVSVLSEVLRRYMAQKIMVQNEFSLDELTVFFQEDFDALPSMTRNPRDWVLDSILNPWVGKLFSTSELFTQGFRQVSSTPRISDDLGWYKERYPTAGIASTYQDIYVRNVHKLIDTRISTLESAPEEMNKSLIIEAEKIYDLTQRFVLDKSPEYELEILACIERILAGCPQLNPKTQSALRCILVWAKSMKESDLSEFRGFWGRGQQHMLFERSEEQ